MTSVDKFVAQTQQESLRWTPTQVPQFLTVQQFCDATQISKTVALQMIAEGRLKATTFNGGRDFRVEVSEIGRVLQPVPPKAAKAKTATPEGAQ